MLSRFYSWLKCFSLKNIFGLFSEKKGSSPSWTFRFAPDLAGFQKEALSIEISRKVAVWRGCAYQHNYLCTYPIIFIFGATILDRRVEP